MKNLKNLFIAFGLFYIIIYSCIPIDDVIPPRIENFDLQEGRTYYYQDTISFNVSYIDNTFLDSGVISIKLDTFEFDRTPDDWDTTIILSQSREEDFARPEGRRFERPYKIVVPEFKTEGSYNIAITVFDQSGNSAQDSIPFTLGADQTKPVFENLNINLDQINEGLYQACRSTIIGIEGGVSDNISLTRIGFELRNLQNGQILQSDSVAVSADSLDISEVFSNLVLVPSDVVNGSQIELKIFAIDAYNNREVSSNFVSFIINIECDDRPPEINFAQTTPNLNVNSSAQVAQGSRFVIDSLIISDDQFLSTARVFFTAEGEALNELYNITLNTSAVVNLADSVNLVFETENEPIGIIRNIAVQAVDSSGNPSAFIEIEYEVIEDTAPTILVTNTYINLIETPWSTTGTTPLQIGDELTLDGKIEELNQLSNISIFWGEESNPTQVVNLNQVQLEELGLLPPVSFSKLLEDVNVTLRVPNNAEIDSIFTLQIIATDSRGQESTPITLYRFIIEQ